jgi:LppP/LprE lipoprotein
VRSRGYLPATGSYDPGASVTALIGVKKGSADGTAQRAFFFADGRFIGTDTADDSAGIRLAHSRPPVIALSYELFEPNDAQCCPTGGVATVRYRWDGQRLAPLDPIPPASYSARGSRR